MTEREYDVLVVAEMSRVVRVQARSMREAKRLVWDCDAGEGLFGTERVGEERIADVVRSGDSWHFDRENRRPAF